MLSKLLPPGQAVHFSLGLHPWSGLASRHACVPPALLSLPSRAVPAHRPACLSPALHFPQKRTNEVEEEKVKT